MSQEWVEGAGGEGGGAMREVEGDGGRWLASLMEKLEA